MPKPKTVTVYLRVNPPLDPEPLVKKPAFKCKCGCRIIPYKLKVPKK